MADYLILGLLLFLLIVVPLCLAVVYRAFKGQWWPLALLIVVPALLWYLWLASSQELAEQARQKAEAEVLQTERIAEAHQDAPQEKPEREFRDRPPNFGSN